MLLFAFTRLLYTFLRENFNVHFIFLVQELFSVLFFSVLVNLIFDLIFFWLNVLHKKAQCFDSILKRVKGNLFWSDCFSNLEIKFIRSQIESSYRWCIESPSGSRFPTPGQTFGRIAYKADHIMLWPTERADHFTFKESGVVWF